MAKATVECVGGMVYKVIFMSDPTTVEVHLGEGGDIYDTFP